MPTIIDELIVVLGWGATQQQTVEKGHREAEDALKKTKDRSVKQAEEIEGGNEGLAETFAKITTEAALFFAALAAFDAAKDLIIKVNRSNSALGRFAKNVGMAPQEVASWSMTAERMGGSAEDAQASINSMSKALYDLHTQGGNIPTEIRRLSALSNMPIDTEHGLPKFMADIAAAAQKLSKTDMTQTHFLLQGAGIGDATANTMIKYGAGMSAYVDSLAKGLAPSKEAIKAAQDLNEQFARAHQNVTSLGNSIATELDPQMTTLLGDFSQWVEDNKALETSTIVDWATKFGDALKTNADVVKHGLDTLGQAEDFLDRTAPRSILHPRTPPLRWSEWWKSGEQFLRKHNPLDIGAHADELPPVDGQQVSRGNPLPIDVLRIAGQGADANSLLGGPIGSRHGASDGLRARGTPGGGGSGPNVTPQPDDTVQSLAAKYSDRYPHLSSQQCVALAMAAAGIGGTVRDWRRGDSVKDTALEPGTPIATFINPDGTPSDRYAGGGIGAPGANRDHAAIFLGKTNDGIWVEEQYTGSGGPHARFYPWNDPRGGEKSAENYFAINDSHGRPAGTHNPHRHTLTPFPKTSALIPSGGAKMALAGNPVASSKSTSRNITNLQVRGGTAQEIADGIVAGVRAELTA